MICSKCPSELLLCAVPAQDVAPGPPYSLGAQPEAVAEIRVPPDAVGMGDCCPVPGRTGVALVWVSMPPSVPIGPEPHQWC